MVQLIFIMLAAGCWAVMSHLLFHNKNSTPFRKHRFFGSESWKRKYKRAPSKQGVITAYEFYPAPDNWYYKTFKIKYEEKFPWGATALVFLTDGFHLFQWFMIKFILLALTVTYHHSLHFDWVGFIMLWIAWSLIFNFVYVGLKK
mgnify:CR=1 FL=1